VGQAGDERRAIVKTVGVVLGTILNRLLEDVILFPVGQNFFFDLTGNVIRFDRF